MTTTKTASADLPTPDFRRRLMRWYRRHGRHLLPWRETRDPYAVLVSEVMLQQTQVDRVVPYYREWMARWPTLEALAAAPLPDVIRAWSGLGYNRRAVNLHRTAAAAVALGGLPSEPAALAALPGIGKYTAAAVACFACDAPVAVLDTNVSRVIVRSAIGRESPRDVSPVELHQVAARLLPFRNPRDHNLALMDFGATLCTSRAPQCGSCPLATLCRWRAEGSPAASERPASNNLPFLRTARFARGRLIAALRQADAASSESDLADALPPDHRPRLTAYLAGLRRDGLVEKGPDGWALAGSQTISIASPKL